MLKNLIEKYSATSVHTDSRAVTPGGIFVAIKGEKFDGNNFIEEAIKNGAVLVLTDSASAYEARGHDNIILVEDARKTLAEAAILLKPESPTHLLAVTGTNGKSSAVHFISGLLSMSGHQCASIGTLGVQLNSKNYGEALINTSPDAVTLASIFADLHRDGVEYCAMEASSIGLDQYRLHGRIFNVVGFTSFSPDHLDYHKSMDEYLAAKLRIFSDNMDDNSIAVINRDMEVFDQVAAFLARHNRRYFTYGDESRQADFAYKILQKSTAGQRFSLKFQNQEHLIDTPVLGEFQVANIVLSLSMLHFCGFGISEVKKSVSMMNAPSGRLEKVAPNHRIGERIFVDYAHTPDALLRVLTALKPYVVGRLICVFGCGGDRDKTKRSIMGKVAYENADLVIITDDNPRSEDPASIRREIAEYCPNAMEIADRKQAIVHAISLMTENDILVIAGKGHENYQLIGKEKLPFSDKEVALEIV